MRERQGKARGTGGRAGGPSPSERGRPLDTQEGRGEKEKKTTTTTPELPRPTTLRPLPTPADRVFGSCAPSFPLPPAPLCPSFRRRHLRQRTTDASPPPPPWPFRSLLLPSPRHLRPPARALAASIGAETVRRVLTWPCADYRERGVQKATRRGKAGTRERGRRRGRAGRPGRGAAARERGANRAEKERSRRAGGKKGRQKNKREDPSSGCRATSECERPEAGALEPAAGGGEAWREDAPTTEPSAERRCEGFGDEGGGRTGPENQTEG